MTNEEYFEQIFPSLVNADAFTIGGRRFVSMDKVLEIIYGYKSKATEPTKISASAYNILLDRMKHEVFALKGGEQE